MLSANQRFEVVPDDSRKGEWKIKTRAYAYVVSVATSRAPEPVEVFAWHWHPVRTPARPFPHLHVRTEHRLLGLALKNLHIPTGRTSFEEVVRFVIEELRAEVLEDDWQAIVAETETRFREYRTWA